MKAPAARFASLLLLALTARPVVAQTPATNTTDDRMGAGQGHGADLPPLPSTTLVVVVSGNAVLNLSLSDVQGLPQTTVSVFNAQNHQNETYSGPLVSDLLAKAGFALTAQSQHTVLGSYVLATGMDGDSVLFSAAELEPALHKAQVIVAVAQAGQPLTRTGNFQLIDSMDAQPARWVRNLHSLSVVPVAAPQPSVPH